MKKFVINGRFLSKNINGVSRYAMGIVNALDRILDKEEIVCYLLLPSNIKKPHFKHIKVVQSKRLRGILWENISLPAFAKKINAVVLNLANVSPLINPGIVCIHDMRIRVAPKDYAKIFIFWYRLQYANAVLHSKFLLTVSEFSKKEILRYYKVNPEKIGVITNSWQHMLAVSPDEDTLKRYKVEKQEYYFSLSSIEPNKNMEWILQVTYQNPEEIFVIAGGSNKRVFQNAVLSKYPENLILLGRITDNEAIMLMKNAKAFIYPTFYEGFGIPPLEAIYAGAKSIVISDTEVMHEIYGVCGTYINPYKPKMPKNYIEITENMRKEILSKYSWEASAEMLVSYLKSKC